MEENRSTILRINENAGNGSALVSSTLLPLPTLIRWGLRGEERGKWEEGCLRWDLRNFRDGFRGARRRVVVSRLRRRHRANVAEIKSLTLLTDALVSAPTLFIWDSVDMHYL